MGPEQTDITISEYISLKRLLTWTVMANHIKLLFITFANASTVERCKSDTAACSRMCDFTGGLGVQINLMSGATCPPETNLFGASAENDPECSSNVENILSAGVASSTAVSADAFARHRFRQTFNARILAFCTGGRTSSATQSSSMSISSLITTKSGLDAVKTKMQHPHRVFRPSTHEQFLDQECHNTVTSMLECIGFETRHLRQNCCMTNQFLWRSLRNLL